MNERIAESSTIDYVNRIDKTFKLSSVKYDLPRAVYTIILERVYTIVDVTVSKRFYRYGASNEI